MPPGGRSICLKNPNVGQDCASKINVCVVFFKETPMVNINDVSVIETKEKSHNPALWQKIGSYSAFLEDILFLDERSGW